MILDLSPLPSVLFPRSSMPLYIFEPRYLEMVGRCIRERQPFGVILLKSGRAEGEGPVEVHKIGTIAHVIASRRRPDGTMNIRVAGRERFRVLEIVSVEPRVVANVRTVQWQETDLEPARALAPSLRLTFAEYLRLLLAITGQWVRAMDLPKNPQSLAEFVSAGLHVPMTTRQRLLEYDDLPELMRFQLDLLRAEITRLGSAVEERGKGRVN